ncbi:ComEA family DNA-binding protein [Bacteroidota bacterium]
MNPFSFLQVIFLILLLPPNPKPHPQEPQREGINPKARYVVMIPTGDSTNGFPLLAPLPSDDPRTPIVRQLFETTFIREMIPLHDSVQSMLIDSGRLSVKEPLYLLLSGKMGGYPRYGFFLKSDGKILDKSEVPYIDMADVNENYDRLSSITQIYPHELAHIWYRLLSERDPNASGSYSTDVHYFSIVTDYEKAFNEGYAESFENLARLNEPNSLVKKGIEADITRLEEYFPRYIKGFEQDYQWPLRIGYYRMFMVTWFQQLEDYKRYLWAVEGKAKYQPAVGSWQLTGDGGMNVFTQISDPGSRISFRNACVSFDSTKLLNPAQAVSTEGVICSFFTILRGDDPPSVCLPKEIKVINKYLNSLPEGASPIHAFINGYILEFPEEKDRLFSAWREATGNEYEPASLPELWILNLDYHHNFWVMGQFGGLELPFYTFNLNTARIEDLITIPGISVEEAGTITLFRDSVGGFRSFDEVMAVPGISAETASALNQNQLDPDVLDAMEFEGELGLWGLIISTLKRLLLATTIITGIIAALLYSLFYFRKRGMKSSLLMAVRTFFKSLLFIMAGFTAMIFPFPAWMLFLIFILLVFMINFWRTRKRLNLRSEIFLSTIILAMVVSYSLF